MCENPYKDAIVDSICKDIKQSKDRGIWGGAVILTLSAIDAMAYLGLPSGKKEVHRNDYIEWVDRYMKTDPKQSYQYKGIDLYGARCGIVHRYGVESRLSDNDKCKIFSYHNGSEHYYKPQIDKKLVLISIPRFTNDFFKAVQEFLRAARHDNDLKARIDSRILGLFRVSRRAERRF